MAIEQIRHFVDQGTVLTHFWLILQLVLANIVDCLKELITQAQPVKLDGLGTFYPTIENDGKQVTYQEKIPISSYANATADPDDTPQP